VARQVFTPHPLRNRARTRVEHCIEPMVASVFPPIEAPNLLERHHALLSRARAARLPVRYLGRAPLFDGHRVFPGSYSDWVLINAAADPCVSDRDGFPIPAAPLKVLRRMEARGIEFDAIYLLHEVPAGAVRAGEPPAVEALLPPPSVRAQRHSRHLGLASTLLWAATLLPLLSSTRIARTLVNRAAPLGASLHALDPAVFGVLVGQAERELACWYYLTHWIYNQE